MKELEQAKQSYSPNESYGLRLTVDQASKLLDRYDYRELPDSLRNEAVAILSAAQDELYRGKLSQPKDVSMKP